MTINRYTLTIVIAAATLAGCGSSQPPIGARGAMPQASASTIQHDTSVAQPGTGAYEVLHRFGRHAPHMGGGGANPQSGLLNVGGTLYGTTSDGGSAGLGTVYSINQRGFKKLLHSFGGGGDDGNYPNGDLIKVNGTLYGTTFWGGTCNQGTVYSISTTGTMNVLHSFGCSADDGLEPTAGLVFLKGMLYGTTSVGGYEDTGTVYRISSTGTGYKVLYAFGNQYDGAGPYARLLKVSGTLYGTTYYGGKGCYQYTNGCSTVFSITPAGKEHVVYSFQVAQDGLWPTALIDVNGTLYGTTILGGGSKNCQSGCGTVYSITTSGKENVLYRFTGGADGATPQAGLLDMNGMFYGTASAGGAEGFGTVFSLSPSGEETVLHNFGGGSDGSKPYGDLIDFNGRLYGTTYEGGVKSACTGKGCGTVFSLSP